MEISDCDERIIKILADEGVDHFGVTTLERPISFPFYSEWLKSGYSGTMKYLEAHHDMKSNPRSLFKGANSALVVGYSYVPHPEPKNFKFSPQVARYAKGYDYHFWFKKRLQGLINKFQIEWPDAVFRAYTDSAPIMERDLAKKAGLGWIGKNACLIHEKRGSFFLIGEILTSLNLVSTAQPVADRCGHCTMCIDACPTQAIVSPRTVDARKCISYLTIESKSVPPEPLRVQIGSQYFGCDICQQVCPWNQKTFKKTLKDQVACKDDLINDLRFILTSSNRAILKRFSGTPLTRAPAWGHKRNAIIVAGNLKLKELEHEIGTLRNDARLSELASWALKIFTSSNG